MTNENFISEATLRRLAGLLTLEDIGDALRQRLTQDGYMYKSSRLHPNAPPAERQALSAQFIKTIYDIARVLEDDRTLYYHIDDSLFESEEWPEDPTLVEIFEAVLIYSLKSKSKRWREHASKIARILEPLSKEGLSSDDVVSRLEAVGGIEKLC